MLLPFTRGHVCPRKMLLPRRQITHRKLCFYYTCKFGVISIKYVITLVIYIDSLDICDENGAGNFTMCPLCDKRCTYWKLVSSCSYSRATYLFDNYGTMLFAVIMALWGKCFIKLCLPCQILQSVLVV